MWLGGTLTFAGVQLLQLKMKLDQDHFKMFQPTAFPSDFLGSFFVAEKQNHPPVLGQTRPQTLYIKNLLIDMCQEKNLFFFETFKFNKSSPEFCSHSPSPNVPFKHVLFLKRRPRDLRTAKSVSTKRELNPNLS